MKILSAEQIRELDAFTMEQEPVSSIDLMERAAFRLFRWFVTRFPDKRRPVVIICGSGNNGGDGLVLARFLHRRNYRVHLWLARFGEPSPDFSTNLERLPPVASLPRHSLEPGTPFPDPPPDPVLVDALFGSGLNRPLEGFAQTLVDHLNQVSATRVAIDMPSGLFADRISSGTIFRADHTFTFQLPKLAFFLPEHDGLPGEWVIGDIGLSRQGLDRADTYYLCADPQQARGWLRPRSPFSHKGTYGHALLIAGSRGKAGAAVLAARGCLRSGAGLLSLAVPDCAYEILQQSVPEAMVHPDPEADLISRIPQDIDRYEAVGLGPGLDQDPRTESALESLLASYRKPMVWDADALNLLSRHPDWLERLPEGSILTPHPGEFRRLFGRQENSLERIRLQRKVSMENGLIIVLKGGHSSLSLPSGEVWFNATGNPGMATGGSGDVLTGILTGLLSQGYPPEDAARLGVYLHGAAGDLAARDLGQYSLVAGDLPRFLGPAFLELEKKKTGPPGQANRFLDLMD